MTDKRIQATQYLIDLLRCYGGRAIIVKITEKGETQVMAKTFVRTQLTKAGILFPYNEVRKAKAKPINNALDIDMLSVIFHEALIDFELAYVEDTCPEENHKADGFVNRVYDWINRKYQFLENTFPEFTKEELIAFPDVPDEEEKEEIETEATEKAKEQLRSYGIKSINTPGELNAVLWGLAYRHQQITKSLRRAIIELAQDKNMATRMMAINTKPFNTMLNTLNETDPDGGIVQKEDKIKALREQITAKDAALKDYRRKQHNQAQTNKKYRNTEKKLVSALTDWRGRFLSSYDLCKEEDVNEYIGWFVSMDRKISNQLMKSLIEYIPNPELFIQKAEDWNQVWDEKHINDAPDEK